MRRAGGAAANGNPFHSRSGEIALRPTSSGELPVTARWSAGIPVVRGTSEITDRSARRPTADTTTPPR